MGAEGDAFLCNKTVLITGYKQIKIKTLIPFETNK